MTTKQMEFCIVYQKGFKMVICFCGDTSNSKKMTAAVTGRVGYITDNKNMKEKSNLSKIENYGEEILKQTSEKIK